MNGGYSKKTTVIALLSAAALLVNGCEQPAAVNSGPATGVVTARPVNELTMALDSMRLMYEPNGEQAESRTLFYLNQWLGRQETSADWKPDPLLGQLPKSATNTPALADLDRLQFSGEDRNYLQQSLWLRDVVEGVKNNPPPADLQPWLKEVEKSSGVLEAEQLATAERLFDWTIRNIQLDPLPPPPPAPKVTVGASSDPNAALPPPLRGELGPGYAHRVWQVLLQGHGDSWERSRVFLQLARQAGIDGAMLAIADPRSAGSSQPWACGLLIDKELYVFDAELGLPIPGPEGQGIATLKQLVEDPELLRQLDIEDGPEYSVTADDLQRLVALIEADPEALSQRMALLQKGIPSNRRMAVSVSPSALQPRLRSQPGIQQVAIWRVPFEAELYQYGARIKRESDPEAYQKWLLEEGLFQGRYPLVFARNQHLQGVFGSVGPKLGARELYLSVRPPEKVIDKLATSARMREQSGLNMQLPDDPAARSAALESMAAMARRTKQHATYWLGLSYYETGAFESADEWLDRTLEAKSASPWQAGARYNLARTYESLDQPEKARELYLADDSPQKHGNLLRAKMLESKVEK